VTAKPFLERWMHEQLGWRALERRIADEIPYLISALPEIPRLLHQRLQPQRAQREIEMAALLEAQRTRNRWLAVVAVLLAAVLAALLVRVPLG